MLDKIMTNATKVPEDFLRSTLKLCNEYKAENLETDSVPSFYQKSSDRNSISCHIRLVPISNNLTQVIQPFLP